MGSEDDATNGTLKHRLREGLRMFEAYLEQPETERAGGASALLAGAQRAQEQLVRVTEEAIRALPRTGDEGADDRDTDPRAAALAATPGIANRAGLPLPDDIAALAGSGNTWVADASARYTGFVVAALTAQDALLEGTLEPADYARVLLATARELLEAG
jgi:hypothetical protein